MPQSLINETVALAEDIAQAVEKQIGLRLTVSAPRHQKQFLPPIDVDQVLLVQPIGAEVAIQGNLDQLVASLSLGDTPEEMLTAIIESAAHHVGFSLSAVEEKSSLDNTSEVVVCEFAVEELNVKGFVITPAARNEQATVSPVSFTDFGPETSLKGSSSNGDMTLLSDIELEITVEIGRKELTIEDILKLKSGTVIELDKQLGEPVEVFANGTLIAEGEVVVVDERFAVRITRLLSKKKRKQALL